MKELTKREMVNEYIGIFFVIMICYGLLACEWIYGKRNADKIDQMLSRRINKV
jgi:hypothetical protein